MTATVTTLFVALFCLAQQPLSPSAVEDVLARTLQADDANASIERNYVFQERTETRLLDGKGKVKSKESETYDTILSGGRPYRHLISKNDKPLSPAEEKKEQAKRQKEIDDRNRETPEQREKALAQEEVKRKKNRELAHDSLNAFQFRLASETADTWVFELTPKPGFQARSRETAILKHFRGKLWIRKADHIWTRLDAEAVDDVSFGLVLARLDKGSHFVVERTLVNNEVWLPKRIAGGGAARIAIVKKLRIEFETIGSNFRRFTSDSRLVTDPLK